MKKLLFFLLISLFMIASTTYVLSINNYVIDNAELLSDPYESILNEKIKSFREKYNADIVVVTTTTLNGKSPMVYADDFYDENGYSDDGVLLLISIEDNDVYISTSGFGIKAFTDYGIDKCIDNMIDYLSGGDFEKAVSIFISTANTYFESAKSDRPYDVADDPVSSIEKIMVVVVIWIIAFVISLLVTNNMKAKLKSIHSQDNANDYIQNSRINLIHSNDIFLYKNITKVRIPKESSSGGRSSGGGGSSTHRSSSGRTHGGGGRKF